MVDVVLQNAWVLYHISKVEGDVSLPLLAYNFLKYSKEVRSSWSYVGIQNVPADACYEAADYQVPYLLKNLIDIR